MYILKKYGTATTLVFPLIDAGTNDFESTPVTFASGDTQISKDEGAFTNTTNNPAHEGNGIYSLALTATEMQAATIVITLIDSATKAWEDQSLIIDTYGNASAEHAFDLDTATQTVDLSATAVDDVWDEPVTGHLTAGTTGLSETLGSAALIDATVTGTPTTTTFDFTGGNTNNDFYNDQLVYILSGTGAGQVRVITDSAYSGGTTTLTVDEAFIVTPAASDRFAILVSHVHPVSQIADGVWDEVLTGATHNIATSAGRRLRQIDDAFIIHSGTAQAGTANTITLDTGASATNDIYAGDRIAIIAGTGAQEHGICTTYNGTTKVATMSQNWVITPDATSEFELTPADVDIETWQHVTVQNGATSNLPVVDSQAISDNTTAADNAETYIDASIAAVLAMLDDPRTEPGQGAPAVNPDAMTKLDYLYKWTRNKKDNDGSTTQFYADDGSTVDHKQTTSSLGGTVTKGEIESGP